MKFVHLAPRDAVGMIKRRGIRMGDGRRGKGVYAVPLVPIPRYAPKDPENETFRSWSETDRSEPVSSQDAWRWLFHPSQRRGARPIAVMFELPPTGCEMEWFGDLHNEALRPFLERWKRAPVPGVHMSAELERRFHDAFNDGAWVEVNLTMTSTAALGAVVHRFLEAGGQLPAPGSWQFEVVIRSHVPRSAIIGLEALSQTNGEARDKRRRHAEEE